MIITVAADISGLEGRFSEAALKDARTQFARRVADDSNRYCKWDTGATWESMVGNSDFAGGSITWATPYAEEAYLDPRIGQHPTVPNGKTSPHARWFEVAKGRHQTQWNNLVRSLLTS